MLVPLLPGDEVPTTASAILLSARFIGLRLIHLGGAFRGDSRILLSEPTMPRRGRLTGDNRTPPRQNAYQEKTNVGVESRHRDRLFISNGTDLQRSPTLGVALGLLKIIERQRVLPAIKSKQNFADFACLPYQTLEKIHGQPPYGARNAAVASMQKIIRRPFSTRGAPPIRDDSCDPAVRAEVLHVRGLSTHLVLDKFAT